MSRSTVLRPFGPLEWGEPRAQFNLGVALATGQGVRRDLLKAHKWFSLASSRHYSSAEAALRQLERALSPDQIREARKLSEQWKEKKRNHPDEMADWEWLSMSPEPLIR